MFEGIKFAALFNGEVCSTCALIFVGIFGDAAAFISSEFFVAFAEFVFYIFCKVTALLFSEIVVAFTLSAV